MQSQIRARMTQRSSAAPSAFAPEAVENIRRRRINHFANWVDAQVAGPGVLLNASVISLSHKQLYTTLRDQWFAPGAAHPPIGPTGSKPSAGE